MHNKPGIRIPKMLWVVGALLCLAAALNYLDRGALGVVTKEIYHDVSMNDRDYSYVTAAFLIAYAIMYAGSGFIVDRLGTRLGFSVFIFSWSVSQILHGFTVGKWSLAACRFLLGLSEPAAWPAAANAADEWFPPNPRALGLGIFNSRNPIAPLP